MQYIKPDKILIDGFAGVGRNFRFLGQGSHYQFPSVPLMEFIGPTFAKGLVTLEGKNILGIKLYPRNELDIYLLVCVGRRGARLEIDFIRDCYVNAVDRAMEKIELSESAKLLKYATCCNTCLKRSASCKLCANSRRPIKLFPTDIPTFGDEFMQYFQVNLEEKLANVETCLLAIRTGQNAKFYRFVKKLSGLKICTLIEVVIHVANDFESETDKVYMWRVSTANQFKGPDNEISWFHPTFMGKVGNFVIKSNSQDIILDENDVDLDINVGPEHINVPRWMVIKMYNSVFKELHNGNPMPFGKDVLSDVMCGKGNVDNAKLVLEWIHSTHRAIQGLQEERKNTARCEVLYSVLHPDKDWWRRIRMTNRELSFSAKMLEKMDVARLLSHINVTFVPLLNTLEVMSKQFIERRNNNPAHIESIQTIRLASICQCLVGWGIYGATEHRDGKVMFQAEIIQALALRQKAKFRDCSSGPNQNAELLSLNFFPHVRVVSSEIDNDPRQFVQYDGPCMAFSQYLVGLRDVVGGNEGLKAIVTALEHVSNGEDIDGVWKVFLSETVWRVVTKLSFEHYYRNSTNPVCLDQIARLLPRLREMHPLTTREFINWCFEENFPNDTVRMLLSCVSHVLGSQEEIAQWKMMTALLIESKLYGMIGPFLFPNDPFRCMAVFPFYKPTVGPNNQREKIREIYNFALNVQGVKPIHENSEMLGQLGNYPYDFNIGMDYVLTEVRMVIYMGNHSDI